MWLVTQRTNKNYVGTVLLPIFVNSLKLTFTWTAPNILFLPHKNLNTVSTCDNDHPHEFWDFISGIVMESILLRCDAVSWLAVPDVSKNRSSFIFRCIEGSDCERHQQTSDTASHPTRINTLWGIHQLFWEEHTTHNCTLCGQNAEFLNVKAHGTYHYHYSCNIILLSIWIIHISVRSLPPSKYESNGSHTVTVTALQQIRIKCIQICSSTSTTH
jgi:hypothetical protein